MHGQCVSIDPTTPLVLDSFEVALLRHVITWSPYGGPRDEDVFLEFGITVAEYQERVRDIVSAAFSRRLSQDQGHLVLTAARATGITAARPRRSLATLGGDGS